MFCFYCGKNIDDDLSFCPFCGREIEQVDTPVPPIFTMSEIKVNTLTEEMSSTNALDEFDVSVPDLKADNRRFDGIDALPNDLPKNQVFINEQYEKEKEREKKEQKPKKKIKTSTIIIIILSVLVAAGLGIGAYLLFGNSGGDEVDLESLIYTPSAYGYDGHGEMDTEMYIDEEKMNAYLGTIKNEERRSAVKGVLLTVLYYPDNCEKLSNGDEITITAEYDKEMAKDIELTIINDTFTYTVEGLEEGEDIAYDPSLCDEYPGDFVFTDSDENYLDEAYAYYATGEDEDMIQRAINEIYARHGMIFTDSVYSEMYESCVWYTPVYTKEEIKDSWFNVYEKANIKFLVDYRSTIKSENSYVKCATCGKKIKKRDAVEDYGDYYCESCFYDSPPGQEYYNELYNEEEE